MDSDERDRHIETLERKLASALLTGNENAVNCDAHGEPIAFIPAEGECPGCRLERDLAKARDLFTEAEEREAFWSGEYYDERKGKDPKEDEYRVLTSIDKDTRTEEQTERLRELARHLVWRADSDTQYQRAETAEQQRDRLREAVTDALLIYDLTGELHVRKMQEALDALLGGDKPNTAETPSAENLEPERP